MKQASLLFLFLFPLLLFGQETLKKQVNSAGQLIERIIHQTGATEIPGTVDVIKEGSPAMEVTGIATCMFATMDVLRTAVAKNCNLIITHEPLYYNHLDETNQLLSDPVFLEKKKFINEHKLVIWRFHDYIHSIKPDGIQAGMVDKLGWKKYAANEQLEYFILPETTLKGLVEYLKKLFPANAFYVVGKPDMKVKNVWLAPGAPGSGTHIPILEKTDADVVISGEAQQWETYEYTRDANEQGRSKAAIFLGHIPSEAYGMEWCVNWLKGFIKDIPIQYIECGPSYWSY